jgi:hypothetical protein
VDVAGVDVQARQGRHDEPGVVPGAGCRLAVERFRPHLQVFTFSDRDAGVAVQVLGGLSARSNALLQIL